MTMICRCKRGTRGSPVAPKCHTLKALCANGFTSFFERRGTVAPKIHTIYKFVRVSPHE